jgi:tetratricopeptide (TPR) repeat protein
MRLEEYTQFLKTDSPSIEFFTKNGKTIVCRKEADEMQEQLKQAEDLLQAMVESRDVPTIEVIHQLCDLATVLDQLKLQEECIVVGDCAMKLAQALGLRAFVFQKEQAQTIARIAGLDVYQSRACPLFIQAISVCEAFVIEDGSNSAKLTLLEILGKAGSIDGHDTLCVQWLGRAIDLIAELPSAMVNDILRGGVYTLYGVFLGNLKVDTKALAAKERAVTFWRSLSEGLDQDIYCENLAIALYNYGITLHDIGHLEDAARVKREALTLYQTLVDLGHDEHKEDLADAHTNYVVTLCDIGHFEDAARVGQQAVTLYQALVDLGHDKHKMGLARALNNYGNTLRDIGHLEDAARVGQQAVTLYQILVDLGHGKHKERLALALNNYGLTLQDIGHFEDAARVGQQAVTLYQALVDLGQDNHKWGLAHALNNYGNTLREVGHLEDAAVVGQQAVTLYQTLVDLGHDKHKERLALALRSYAVTLRKIGHLEDAARVEQQAVTLKAISQWIKSKLRFKK